MALQELPNLDAWMERMQPPHTKKMCGIMDDICDLHQWFTKSAPYVDDDTQQKRVVYLLEQMQWYEDCWPPIR